MVRRRTKKKSRVGEWKGVEEVEWVRWKNMGLRHVKIPCGKVNCTKCPHGPYWYLVIWRGGKPSQWYIGRYLFSNRLRRFPDREMQVKQIVEQAGYVVPPDEYQYMPETK